VIRVKTVTLLFILAAGSLFPQPVIQDAGQNPGASFGYFNIFSKNSPKGSTALYHTDYSFIYNDGNPSSPLSVRLSRSGYFAETIYTGDLQTFRLDSRTAKISLSTRYGNDRYSLEPYISLGRTENSAVNNASLRITAFPSIMKGGKIGVSIFGFSDAIDIYGAALNQTLDLPVSIAGSGSGLFTDFLLTPSVSLSAGYSQTFPDRKTPRSGFYSYAALKSSSAEIKLTKQFAGSKFSLLWTSFSSNGNAEALYGIDVFSYITLQRLKYQTISLESEMLLTPRSRLNYSAGYISLSGKVSGTLQTWPFTTLLINTFGNRLNMRAEGTLSLFTGGLGYTSEFSSFSVNPHLSFYHIKPAGSLETWQPAFLVFGVRYYRRSVPSFSSAGIGLAEIDFTWQLPLISINVSGSQYFPIYINKITSPSSGEPGLPGPSVKTKSDGGRRINLSINLNL